MTGHGPITHAAHDLRRLFQCAAALTALGLLSPARARQLRPPVQVQGGPGRWPSFRTRLRRRLRIRSLDRGAGEHA